ncbi:MAG TPA: alpha/beta hydrolase [Gammaproteobacteria bacterium]|nr:alpha/beta hydrolase [Gammaproteobacteria bacterium]HIL98973.1 alpha/beta hydrolase [Pseudomonadales bacterium]
MSVRNLDSEENKIQCHNDRFIESRLVRLLYLDLIPHYGHCFISVSKPNEGRFMIKKISIGILASLVLISVVTYIFYSSFRDEQLDLLASGSQIADTSAGPIEYQMVGNTGPVLLFLHGTPGGYDQAPPTPGFRVLAPSRPGYLRTPLVVGRTPVKQAQAYAALLESLDIDSVIVMGASGGGPSSLAFASLYPERTVALIAMEAVSQKLDLGEESEAPAFMQSDFVMWAMISLMNRLMGPEGIVGLMIPDPANQQLVLQDAEKTANLGALMWSIWPISQRETGQRNDSSVFSSLDLPNSEITVPTLIIHGTEDINVPFAQSEILVNQIPGAILHRIEGGDHMMPFSHSEEVETAIDQFLATLNIGDGN